MVVRVDREIFDPVGSGSTASGVAFYEDGSRPEPWQPRPFTTKSEYIVSEALRLMSVPAEEIMMIRPQQPQQLMPEMFGYDTTPLTIMDVLDADRWTPQIRSWMSGTPRQIRHADSQEDMWSGTLRNFVSTPNPAG